MKGKDFFWFAAGTAILLVAAYGVFSGRINEFTVNPKSGEFKINMMPPSSQSMIRAGAAQGQNGGVLSQMVPGIGPVEVKDDDEFVMVPEKGGAIDRNLGLIKKAVIEGRPDIRYQQEDSGGMFSVWVRYADENQQGERCIHYTTWYHRFSRNDEWGLFQACKTNDGWRAELDPDFASLLRKPKETR
ncbi:MAG: hypothetical protein ABSC05_36440 [Candidatus Solibacter sp.]|jgi:hypothetical protein